MGESRNVDQPGSPTIGRRPEIVTAEGRWAKLLERPWNEVRHSSVGLDILARIVVERLPGLLIDTSGPVDIVEVRLDAEHLAVLAIHRVEKAVTRRMGE